ncbi:hypothetical protein [Hymenobacter sp. BRD67]|uniref:hypothetical protein n=1 Tax=Hymenobacter sp. BRD67 TaxID=2675877 RepID=UPI001564B224|nr:hypothetical protein [Hymenobacter sp. BRD67]QKG55098.1 hypothetical protein GKZ67_22005 [Hymenobacter sp. BRD67]
MRLAQRQWFSIILHPRQFLAPRTTQVDPQAVATANKLASWPAPTALTKSRPATAPTWPWPRALGLPGLLARRLLLAGGGDWEPIPDYGCAFTP